MTREKVQIPRYASAFGVAAYAKGTPHFSGLARLVSGIFDASLMNVIPAQAGIQEIIARVFRPITKGEPEGSDYIVMKIKSFI